LEFYRIKGKFYQKITIKRKKFSEKNINRIKNMASFEIYGGKALKGELTPQGAKNETLQILCAILLTSEKVTISNIPDIIDVNKLINLLQVMGVNIEKVEKGTFIFQAKEINLAYLETEDFKLRAAALRGSIMIVGPLLARFGKGFIPKPGGDKIGRRRLDTHFDGLAMLGAKFNYDAGEYFYTIEAEELIGTYIHLDEPSVTGTANILMASVLAKGKTTIYNAACEPYLQQLCKMLNSMGAKIEGIGSNLLHIEGVEILNGCFHRILPDMIEIGSFIGLAAMTKSEITIKDVGYEHLGIIPNVFKKLGIKLERRGDDIYIPAQESYEIETFIDGSLLTIADGPWPLFTPDLLSIILVVATQAKGSVLIHQKMFESRLFFVDKLIDMGAQIILCDPHRASVIGMNNYHKLRGISMTSPDIRAGVSLLIAALSAEGKSIIHNIEQIDRGYQNIDIRLNNLGADIRRIG
jgi:UDP-N-acetylglucosamine 1-carboxyvinyltransferase